MLVESYIWLFTTKTKLMFKKPFSFEGRIRRTEYGLTYLIGSICLTFILMIAIVQIADRNQFIAWILIMLFIPIYWVIIAAGAKRCHDLGHSGWFQLIPFYFLWMLFDNSQVGLNEYGPNPKGLGNFDEVDELGSHLVS